MARLIGIRHRRKATTEGEARPTQVAIAAGSGKVKTFTLDDDTAELDFLLARFPVAWRKLTADETVVWHDPASAPHGIRPHHCKWRVVAADEDVGSLRPEHLRKVLDPKKGLITQEVVQIPTTFEGLQPGDTVVMVMGGSGDRFAAALARRGEMIVRAGGEAADVFRIPPHAIAAFRGERDKDEDHVTLLECYRALPEAFYNLRPRDFDLIRVGEILGARQSALRDRVACEQRLLQGAVGRIFLDPSGHYPEGVIEAQFDRLKANDQILQGLIAEEKRWSRELAKLVGSLEIFQVLFAAVPGCGERLAASLIAGIGDIRRFMVAPEPTDVARLYEESRAFERRGEFERYLPQVAHQLPPGTNHFRQLQAVARWLREQGKAAQAEHLDAAILRHRQRSKRRQRAVNQTLAKLCAFCGVHVLSGGEYGEQPTERQFPRRRTKQKCNWNPSTRQALFLLGDQFNRRPGSHWGQYLRTMKVRLRERHPEPIEVEVEERRGDRTVRVKKQRYTNGHIHKMAIWRTLNRFVRAFGRQWLRYEDGRLSLLPTSPTISPDDNVSSDEDNGEAGGASDRLETAVA